jgi:hypothetical protein
VDSHYFGPRDDPDGALQDFEKRKDVLYGKKKGKIYRDSDLTLRDL